MMGNADAELQRLLQLQRAAVHAEPVVPAAVRVNRLQRAIDLLLSHQRELCEAAANDFGQRPPAITRSMDILPAVLALKYARRRVRRWMRPQRVHFSWPLWLPGASASIEYQPLGVVGLISPWNFPITLTFGPLAGILAAGNRCLIKPSEVTPVLSSLIQRLIATSFDPSEVAVVTGGSDLAAAFCQLPLDHLLFTGSTQVGRRVMSAAAPQLVPLTLELGGKCPAIVAASADLPRAVDRILLGKLANAGQMCLAPDYVYLPHSRIDAFIREARRWAQAAYPHIATNTEYTNLVDARHAERCAQLLADARAQGAQIVPLTEVAADTDSRRMPPTLILGATDAMRLMQEEIFAPLLPLRTYERIEQIAERLAEQPAPLALYYFGTDPAEERILLAHTRSGAFAVNDVAAHFLIESLPFGGVGASGMGAYHGEHGFRRFSHARAVYHQTRLDVAGWMGLRPPYGRRLERSLRWLLRS